ncbi:hypothetical protein F4680DRAFT_453303 [Xylaria scruposa]|nr:hypothetical protein F4680DRAFT_453303 [Xylaria scruposa]
MSPEQHSASCSIAHEFQELPSHNIRPVDGPWRSSEPTWSLTIDHQPSDQFSYSTEPQPWTGVTSSNDDNQATNLSSPSDDWSLNLSLNTMCAEHENPPTPPTAILCPLSPRHNFVEPTKTLELKRETGRDKKSLFPVLPTSLDEGPRPQMRHIRNMKRTRNTLSAARSRTRAKRGEDVLQQRERDLLRDNRMLKSEIGFLREEVLQLKYEILRHGNCKNDYIYNYIQKAARQIGA